MPRWHDWDSSVTCDAASIEQPANTDEVVSIVRRAIDRGTVVRPFGAGHSWSPLVPSNGTLVNLDRMAAPVHIDKNSGKATLQAGIRLRDAGPLLQQHGLTMRNVGAITPQAIAGAVGSGTHGTGLDFGILGTQVSAVKIVDGRGEVRDFNIVENSREMSALRLSLGSLGIIVEMTLDCVPDHSVEVVMRPMDFEKFLRDLPELLKNERVRAYWIPGWKKIYVHTMNSVDKATEPGSVYSWFEINLEWKLGLGMLWGMSRTIPPLTPICNWLQVATGFRKQTKLGRLFNAITTPIPPFHQEAEVAVPIERTEEALREYGDLVRRKKYRVNMTTEIRFSKGDDILLSPGYKRDVCYIGGYNSIYKDDDPFFADFCKDFKQRFDARPHWGKIGAPDRATALMEFPGFLEFEQIRAEFDPHGVFVNDYLRELFAL